MGVVVSDRTREMRMATDNTRANSRKRRPTMPPMKKIGMKTATREMLMDTTVKATSLAPSLAASRGDKPVSMCRATFSSTTMASSTTNPVAMVSAMSERLSREAPSRYMTAKEPTSEATVAAAGMSVARALPKKTKTTRMTSTQEAPSVHSTSAREARMGGVRSISTVRFTSDGRAAANCGSRARTLSTVSMMLAPG